jgi:hypothetical protein
MDVVIWLRGLGLGKYEVVFRENEINERVPPSLTAEDRTCSGELVPRRGRARCRDSLSFPTVMG